jgi:hypothetical protein
VLKLSDVLQRTPQFWRTLGNKCVRLLKDTTAAGRDFDGQGFPAYSEGYAEAKRARKFKRQASTSTKPDLRLSGDMMRDLKLLSASKVDAVLGWPTFGDRLFWNAEAGRAVIDFDSPDDPHPRLSEAAEEALDMDTEERLNRWASEPIDITLKKP